MDIIIFNIPHVSDIKIEDSKEDTSGTQHQLLRFEQCP